MSQHRRMPSWEPLSGMNLTPMINCRVRAPDGDIRPHSGDVRSQLPDARSTQAIDSVGVTVGVSYAGHIWLNDGIEPWRAAPTDLAGRLQRSFDGQTADERVLYLRAEPRTPYRSISPVLRAAHEAGIRRVGLLADRPRR